MRFKVSAAYLVADENNSTYQESCDIRLTTLESNDDPSVNTKVVKSSDVFFYRLGYYDFHKINMKATLARYADSQWYQVDILIDWSKVTEKNKNLNDL